MMKRMLPCFLMVLCFTYSCFAHLADEDDAADGYLTIGEYDATLKLEGNDKLTFIGGGSSRIDAWDSSRIEVYSTSLPLINHQSGIYDIHLNDNSTLLFSGGAIESLMVGKNASAVLTGGTLNLLTIYHYGSMTSNVTFYCQEGWQWLYTSGKKTGITGLWGDGTSFQTTLSNAGSIFPDTWNFVNVEIVPEPATMFLLGIGGLLLCRKK